LDGNKEILETLSWWGREVQLHLKYELFLAKGSDGLTAWARAAKKENKDML